MFVCVCGIFVYLCVYVYVCVYVCMYVHVSLYVFICTRLQTEWLDDVKSMPVCDRMGPCVPGAIMDDSSTSVATSHWHGPEARPGEPVRESDTSEREITKRSESHLETVHAVGRSPASRARKPVAQDAALLRGWGLLLARFVAASLVATAPRNIALSVIGSCVPHVPVPRALSDFKAMWAPCQDDTSLFSASSPGGQLYKWLMTADLVFMIIGYMMMYCGVASLYLVHSASRLGQKGLVGEKGAERWTVSDCCAGRRLGVRADSNPLGATPRRDRQYIRLETGGVGGPASA